MRRKIIQLAGKTLVVSLPHMWVKKYEVEKGDEVEVEENKNSLEISTLKQGTNEKASIDVSGIGGMIKRILGALYKAGYDEIEIRFSTKEEMETSQKIAQQAFVGFEVVNQTKNSLIVKNITTIKEEEFETMLRRVFLIIKEMAASTTDAIKKKDYEWAERIILRDHDTNKAIDFCRRILNKDCYKKVKHIPPLYHIVEQLERIGDTYSDINEEISEKKLSPSEKTTKQLEELNTYFNDFYELFYQFDIKKINDFNNKRFQMRKQIRELSSQTKKEETFLIIQLNRLLDNIWEMNGALMTIKL